MNAAFSEVQSRWDTFLQNIETRFHEVLSQSEAILPDIMSLRDFDPTPVHVAWQGIETQTKALTSKITDTWQEKVSPAFDDLKEAGEAAIAAAGESLDDYYQHYNALYFNEQEKGYALVNKLEYALKGYAVRIFANAARKLSAKATEVLSKTFLCTQCQAPLPVRTNFFRSYYETCTYCQTVNTFEPGTIARNVEHFALHALAEEHALPEYYDYRQMEDKFKSQRDDATDKITPEAVLDAYKAYAAKYLKARIAIIPDLEDQYEKDLHSKIGHIRRGLFEYPSEPVTHTTNGMIDKEGIETIFWQMLAYHYPDGGTVDGEDDPVEITEDTVLADLENNMDPLMADVEATFGFVPEDHYDRTVGEMIDYLHAHRDRIEGGDHVDAQGRWKRAQADRSPDQ